MTCLAVWLTASPVWAQLAKEDIDELRKRGQAEGWTFTVGENPATRYPLEQLCGSIEPDVLPVLEAPAEEPSRDLPPSFDWRDYGGCTPVRSQGGCGSCWAFAAMGLMESYVAITTGSMTNLSEQWLVSCTDAGGCSGGSHISALNYLSCNGSTDPCGDNGAVLEWEFPYVAYDASCECPYQHPYCIPGRSFSGTSVSQIKQAIWNHGPVAVSVYAGGSFQGYSSGVFNDCEDLSTNHAVVLVGWDDALGTAGVWILRNSWGGGWGMGGYMYIEYGCNRVGTSAYHVNFDAADCNGNGTRDVCDLDCGPPGGECYVLGCGESPDCNENDIPDECDLDFGTSPDCNTNAIPDECDIAGGTSEDVDGNGVPDECQRIIYVDGDVPVSGDGGSWSSAFKYLQDALADAGPGDQLRVAEGTYTPDRGAGHTPGARTETFDLPADRFILGGYAGYGQPDPNERDIHAHETILSGDLGHNDGPNFANRSDNSYHVVTANTTGSSFPAHIDGCSIVGGNANGTWPQNVGGAVFSNGGKLLLRNCAVRSSFASALGGGVFHWNSGTITLVNCTCTGNAAVSGAGMYTDSGTITVANSSFSGNNGSNIVGGIYRGGGVLSVTGCILWGNVDSGGSDESAQITEGGVAAANYNCIQGLTGGLGGTGNIGTNPLFIDADGPDNYFGTADDNLRLQPGSPCLDAGDNDAVPPEVTIDRDTQPRRKDDPATADTGNPGVSGPPIVDLGAYEFQPQDPVTIVSAASLIDHGGTELALDLTTDNLEPRQAGVSKIEFTMSAAVISVSAAVDCTSPYGGSVTATPDGTSVTVEFSGPLPNQACCEISLTGDAVDSFDVRTLAGDIDRSGTVTPGDASIIKPHFTQTAAAAGPVFDFDCSGLVTPGDFSVVKPRFGHTAPACP